MTCAHCHSTLTDALVLGRESGPGRPRMFCDDACRHAAGEAKSAKQRRANPRCAYCGNPKPQSAEGRYCGERCTNLALRGTHQGSSSDLPAEMIERIFARTKARLRYERALQQTEGER